MSANSDHWHPNFHNTAHTSKVRLASTQSPLCRPQWKASVISSITLGTCWAMAPLPWSTKDATKRYVDLYVLHHAAIF